MSPTPRPIARSPRSLLPEVVELYELCRLFVREKFDPNLEEVFAVRTKAFDKIFDIFFRPFLENVKVIWIVDDFLKEKGNN